MRSNCETCIHKAVCSKREQKEAYEKELLQRPVPEFVNVSVECIFCKEDKPLTKTPVNPYESSGTKPFNPYESSGTKPYWLEYPTKIEC